MPRRRPRALRAAQWRPRQGIRARRIPGLSARARVAILRMETDRLWPDAVASALSTYRSFLRQPGRYLSVLDAGCPCCDPMDARDLLHEALRRLPPAARAELERLVTRLDEEFERRTVPDPWIVHVRPWTAGAWWRQRSQEL